MINQLISNFYTQAIARDFARDINFRVTQIVPPASIATGVNITDSELVYAKAAKFPGRNITNVEAKYMGLQFNLPGVVEYPNSDSYELEFYCDHNSELRGLFERWSRYTFNDENSTGDYTVPGTDAYIQLAQLKPSTLGSDSPHDVVTEIQLVGVSIRNISDMEFKMAEGKGDVMTFSTTLAYHYYRYIGETPIPGNSDNQA